MYSTITIPLRKAELDEIDRAYAGEDRTKFLQRIFRKGMAIHRRSQSTVDPDYQRLVALLLANPDATVRSVVDLSQLRKVPKGQPADLSMPADDFIGHDGEIIDFDDEEN